MHQMIYIGVSHSVTSITHWTRPLSQAGRSVSYKGVVIRVNVDEMCNEDLWKNSVALCALVSSGKPLA